MIKPKLWVVWLCMVVYGCGCGCCGKRRRLNEVLSLNHVTERGSQRLNESQKLLAKLAEL
jgi:hypothetical protein